VSVTFRLAGEPNDDNNQVNVSNVNGREILRVLHVPGADAPDLCGEVPAAVLARLCMRFMNGAEPDPELAAVDVVGAPGQARLFVCRRREGYLRDQAGRLWRLALEAGPGGVVCWE
jgi:hypothetical protein